MIIGVPKEIKNHEYRVGLVPDIVYELVQAGHPVFVERDAGAAIGFTDEHYALAGAHIVDLGSCIYFGDGLYLPKQYTNVSLLLSNRYCLNVSTGFL